MRPLGTTGLSVPPIGLGTFKIGRTRGAKYPRAYDLPTDAAADRLLGGAVDLGVTLIDTAPAYGVAEERVGRALAHRRAEITLCTKVGEAFGVGPGGDDVRRFDFSRDGIERSVARSLRRLRTDTLDLLLLHSPGTDLHVQAHTPAVETLLDLKRRGLARHIGLSGKTVAGHTRALRWADVLMVEHHPADTSHADLIAEAGRRGVGVLVKKALAAGRMNPGDAIRFGLATPGVSSLVLGTGSLEHLAANLAAATPLRVAA